MRDFPRFLLVGIASGWIAAILARGSVRLRGCVSYVFIGLLGAMLGGYAFAVFGLPDVTRVLGAAAGSLVLLSLVRTLRTR
ncbi:MAG: GlsB/YeaQ/YmgE family stress response membrane protein [Actinomycetota bacterium]